MSSAFPFANRPIIGQEALTPNGLGRVTDFSEDFPHQYVTVCLYYCHHPHAGKKRVMKDVTQNFDPKNVQLIDPGKRLPVAVLMDRE